MGNLEFNEPALNNWSSPVHELGIRVNPGVKIKIPPVEPDDTMGSKPVTISEPRKISPNTPPKPPTLPR